MGVAHNTFVAGESIETSNNSQTTILTYDVPENSSGQMTIRVSARRASDGVSKCWLSTISFRRATGDAEVTSGLLNIVTPFGATLDLITLAAVSISVDNAADVLRIRVTGLASTNMLWFAWYDGHYVMEV